MVSDKESLDLKFKILEDKFKRERLNQLSGQEQMKQHFLLQKMKHLSTQLPSDILAAAVLRDLR